MTTFLSASLPLQPAFIYAQYPAGASICASPANVSTLPVPVLQAEEATSFSFDNAAITNTLIVSYPAATLLNCVALCGSGLTGASVAVYGSTDNFATSNVPLLPATAVSSDAFFWAQHTGGSYTSFKYLFTGLQSNHKIRHLAGNNLVPLPFLEDGTFSPRPVEVTGDHLISYTGLFLGSVTQKAMRVFSLAFGQVDALEEEVFASWAMACLATAQGFFFIPDTSQPTCYFGYVDKTYKYNPVMQVGLYTIPHIPFNARVA